MLHVYVDADACAVKQEIYRVAERYGLKVTLVANSHMRTPVAAWLELVVVAKGADLADDWIAEHATAGDIVITDDIPLAARSLDKGARCLGQRGRPFTEANIADALASRQLLNQLRDQGLVTGGPPAFSKKDRSQFLQSLDQMVNAIRRGA